MAKLTKDTLIRKVKEIAEENNSNFLTRDQFLQESGLSVYSIYSLFPNGWDEITQLAGLQQSPLRAKARIKSDNELFSEYHRIFMEIGKIPSIYQFEARSDFSWKSYVRRFGSKKEILRAYKAWIKANNLSFPKIGATRKKKTGENKKHQRVLKVSLANQESFVNEIRLKEIKEIKSNLYDPKRLIKLCEELNSNFADGNYISTAVLTRAILDHIPPIFNCQNFEDVIASHGGRSFKELMHRLQETSRKISDYHLHSHIQRKEILPNKTQVNFSNEIDVLLSEVVRKLK